MKTDFTSKDCFPCYFLSYPGKKNKLRVYYLSWLRNRILHNDPEVEKKQGWITVGELEGCVHYKVGTEKLISVCCEDMNLLTHLHYGDSPPIWVHIQLAIKCKVKTFWGG